MTQWVRGFIIPDVVRVHELFGRAITVAAGLETQLRGSPLAPSAIATLAQLRHAYVDFMDGLDIAAAAAATRASVEIRQRLAVTQVRADTGATPHLRDLILCAPLTLGPLATGAVGIASVDELNRSLNPHSPGFGPYWRAQEYGTGGVVPSQVGRIIFGSFAFAGGGGANPPQAQYAGGGGGPHPVFLTGRSPDRPSATSGFGTIGVEIQPRRFISYGADAAAIQWRAEIAAVQRRAMERIAAISA